MGDTTASFRLPLGPVIPLAGTALVLGMMTTLTAREVFAVGLVVAFAGASYAISRRAARP